jgi:hypothetical protein
VLQTVLQTVLEMVLELEKEMVMEEVVLSAVAFYKFHEQIFAEPYLESLCWSIAYSLLSRTSIYRPRV